MYYKQFTVAEYIQPKFDVSVTLPPYATLEKPDITAIIAAKYRYANLQSGGLQVFYTLCVPDRS